MNKLKEAKAKFKRAAKYANGDDVYGVNLLAEGLLLLTEAIEEMQRPAPAKAKTRPK